MADMNTAQVRIIDPVLTTVAQGFIQPELVGRFLFPRVPVEISGGQILQFGKEAFMQYNLRRAAGGARKLIDFGYIGAHYALLQDALGVKVPREWMRDASIMPGIDLGTRALRLGMGVITKSLEADQAALALATGSYDGAHQVALSGTAKWSNAASTPLAAIDGYREIIRGSIGVYPNLLTLSPVAFQALRNNPSVIARFQYTTATAVTEDMLAKLMNIDMVKVGKAVTSTDAGVFSDIWGNNAVLSYSPQDPTGPEQPSWGYTYTLNGDPLVEVPYWDPNVKSWIYDVKMERAPVIAGVGAAFLIQNPN